MKELHTKRIGEEKRMKEKVEGKRKELEEVQTSNVHLNDHGK